MFNLPRNSFNLAFIDLSFSLGYFCFPDRVIVLIVVLKWYRCLPFLPHSLFFCSCLPILFLFNIWGNIYNICIITAHYRLDSFKLSLATCFSYLYLYSKHSKVKQTKSAIWFWSLLLEQSLVGTTCLCFMGHTLSSSGRTRIFFTFISKMSYTLQTIWCWLSDKS